VQRGRDLWTHLGKPVSRAQVLGDRRSGGFGETGAALFAQPIAVAADVGDVAVVEKPVEDRGGDHRIAEPYGIVDALAGRQSESAARWR
jgi:hypothetical protein